MSTLRTILKIAGGVTLASLIVRRVVKRSRRKRARHVELLKKFGQQALVGKMCRVRTHEVSDTFGRADFHVDGHKLDLDVRCLSPNDLTSGAMARIVAWHEGSDTYEVVAPAPTEGPGFPPAWFEEDDEAEESEEDAEDDDLPF